MTVLAELDSLIQLLEAGIPANPASAVNIQSEKALQQELAEYFTALEQAFPYQKVEEIYYKHVKREGKGNNEDAT